MFVFTPIDITDSNLVSTVPEPDTGETVWDSGTTYNTGDQVIKTETHLVYQSAVDSNTVDPEIGVDTVPPSWVEVSPTNKYKMFNDIAAMQTESDGDLVVEIEPDSVLTSVAGFNVDSVDSINIKLVDPVVGEVYNSDVQLRDSSNIFSWYDYFFEDIISVSEFIITDLPPYKSATLTVTFSSDSPKVGILAIGRQVELGTAEYGSSFALKDYSTTSTDDFGYTTIVKRTTSKQVDFSAFTETTRAQYVFDRLSDRTGIPCVWYGSGEYNDSTLVYGYYSDSEITVSNPSTTSFTLSIEGLV